MSALGPDRVKTGKTQNRKWFPVCPRERTYLPILELLPPPALRERRHRGLARRLVAVNRRAVFVVPEGERPHPRQANWRGGCFHDAPDDSAIGEHVEIVIVPLAGWTARRCALEGLVE